MNGEELFDALGEIDEALLPHRAVKTTRSMPEKEGEDTVFPRPRLWKVLAGVTAACLVVGVSGVLLLGWLFSRPNDWGTEGSTVWTGGCVIEPPEHTHAEDLEPHIKLTLNGLEECYALLEKLELSDEDLTRFLTEKGYGVVGLTDRQQLERLMEILSNLPIPSCAGEAPRQILVDDRTTQVVFAFDDLLVEVQRLPSADTVARKTNGLSRVPEYIRYPLYLGSVSEAGGTVAAHYVLNVNDHAVELEVKAGSQEETLAMLDDLWFQYLNDQPRHGTYFRAGENLDNEMVPMLHINTQTGKLVISGGIAMSYAESGPYVLENGKLTVTTQSATIVFAVLDSENLLLLDDGGFGFWLKEGDRYKWSDEYGS